MKRIFRMVMVAGIVAAGASTTMAGVAATGGNKTNDVSGYRIHTFTNSGTFSVQSAGDIEVLVVAGGGGGGGTYGGGGGAGGLIYSNVFPVSAIDYTVTVGGGGAGGPGDSQEGTTGDPSVFGSLTAAGGGGGGNYTAGKNGGSGGGGSQANRKLAG